MGQTGEGLAPALFSLSLSLSLGPGPNWDKVGQFCAGTCQSSGPEASRTATSEDVSVNYLGQLASPCWKNPFFFKLKKALLFFNRKVTAPSLKRGRESWEGNLFMANNIGGRVLARRCRVGQSKWNLELSLCIWLLLSLSFSDYIRIYLPTFIITLTISNEIMQWRHSLKRNLFPYIGKSIKLGLVFYISHKKVARSSFPLLVFCPLVPGQT